MKRWVYFLSLGVYQSCFGATLTLVNTYQSSMPTNTPFDDVSAMIYNDECEFLEFAIVPFSADPIVVKVKGHEPFKIQWLDLHEKPIGVTRDIHDGDEVNTSKMNASKIPICGYIDPEVEE